MMFQVRFHQAIESGTITVTYRCWDAPRVKIGHRYRFGLRHQTRDFLVVDAIDTVTMSSLRDIDARAAGYKNRAELRETLAKYATPRTRVYRIKFHYAADQEDVRVALRQDLSVESLDVIIDKLARMDERSPTGPWTRQVLRLIESQPLTAASRLAPQLGRELLSFKTDVRKLKALGLTISHEVGYELSPRGHALLSRLKPGAVYPI